MMSPFDMPIGNAKTLSGRIQEWLGAKQPNQGGSVQEILSARFQPTPDDVSRAAVETLFGGRPVSGQQFADKRMAEAMGQFNEMQKADLERSRFEETKRHNRASEGLISQRLMGSQPQQSIDAMLPNPGVPSQVPDPYQGVQGRSRDALINNLRQNYIKQLNNDKAQAQLTGARDLLDKTGRFQELLNVQDTGGAAINTPGIGGLMTRFDPELNEMKSIQSYLAPKMRTPGSGSSSDFDVQMFLNATVDPRKPKQSNQNIATAFSVAQQNVIDRDQFMRDYLDYHGHLAGAEQYWNQYLNENPIFDRSSTPENLKLNTDRLGYRDYFLGNKPQPKGQADDSDLLDYMTPEERALFQQ